MGLLDFIKDAGEKILGKEAKTENKQEMEQALVKHVKGLGLKVEGLSIEFNNGIAVVRGKAPSQADKEKIVLAVGNVKGVERVDDQLTIEAPKTTAAPEPGAVFYTVKKGDTLSKIAKEHYRDANKYMTIFEANKPMLKDPDKIYPGQVLRIPQSDPK